MSHLFKMSEWEMGGRWYVNDVEELASSASKWYAGMRMLDTDVKDYLDTLKAYNAKNIKYLEQGDVLMFSFDNQADARKFKNYMNRKSRERNFICG